MWLSTIIKVGRSVVLWNVSTARASISRSLASATRVTFQPYPTKRVATSSLNDQSAGPSRVMPLWSYIQHRFESLRCPASDAASPPMPSIKSPSEHMAYRSEEHTSELQSLRHLV